MRGSDWGGFPGGKASCDGKALDAKTSKTWRTLACHAGALVGVALAYFIVAKLGFRFALINPSVKIGRAHV